MSFRCFFTPSADIPRRRAISAFSSPREADGLFAVFGLTRKLHVGLAAYHERKAHAHDKMVVGEKYSDFAVFHGWQSMTCATSRTCRTVLKQLTLGCLSRAKSR